jgi:ABC-type transport system involved in multi-copper enzyme maturation permease subunit
MLSILIQKELKAIIHSPKFTATFTVCSLLILLSVFTGIREYKTSVNGYQSASQLVEQELLSATSWGRLHTRVYRAPDPMQIFVSGVDYDIGRWSFIADESTAKLRNSAYSDDPIFAVFRFIDFAFIVQFILTLFAILFTYDAVNGEREDGTLKLIFSNPVSRVKYLIAKCVGSWLGLVVPISIPILLGMLMLIVFKIPLETSHWIRIAGLMSLSLALFTFFIVLGVFISSLTRRSAVSFLTALVVWVIFIMIIPRAGVMASGNLVYVPRVAEIESQISGFAKNQWDEFYEGVDKRWADYNAELSNNGVLNDEILWRMMETEDSARTVIEQTIDDYDLKLREDLRQRKIYQEKLAFTLSRLSPASAFQLGAMSLAGTDTRVKNRYEENINNYRNEFYEFVEGKKKETGDMGGIMMSISVDDKGNRNMVTSGGDRNEGTIDVSELPRFSNPKIVLQESFSTAIIDLGLIVVYTILSFMGAFITFLRYDMR